MHVDVDAFNISNSNIINLYIIDFNAQKYVTFCNPLNCYKLTVFIIVVVNKFAFVCT